MIFSHPGWRYTRSFSNGPLFSVPPFKRIKIEVTCLHWFKRKAEKKYLTNLGLVWMAKYVMIVVRAWLTLLKKVFYSSTVSGCLKLENCLFPPYFLPDKGSPPLELDSQLHPHRILSEMILLSTNILTATIAQIEYLQTLSWSSGLDIVRCLVQCCSGMVSPHVDPEIIAGNPEIT